MNTGFTNTRKINATILLDHLFVEKEHATIEKQTTEQLIVTAHDICGILYYVCNQNIVYDPEDVMSGKINASAIGIFDHLNSHIKLFNGYSIP